MRRLIPLICLLSQTVMAAPSVSLARHDDPAVQQAVREAAASMPAQTMQAGADFSTGEMQRFDLALKEAEVPDCLHADGLKRQPPVVLFIPVAGVLALPFVGIAKLRGKCK